MWAIELGQYNEWMSEEDYEVDDQGRRKNHKVSVLRENQLFLASLENEIDFRTD